MITVVDYGRGNLFSIRQALSRLGFDHCLTTDPDCVRKAEHLLLPGVGAFGDAMETLHRLGMAEAVREAATRGTRLLGICLGMQMLADLSHEFGRTTGLSLIPGEVVRIPEGEGDADDRVRVPNVGWRELRWREGSPVFAGLEAPLFGYFVHSFWFRPAVEADVASTIRINQTDVTAIVQRDNIVGFQFHPEKSGPSGLRLLANALA